MKPDPSNLIQTRPDPARAELQPLHIAKGILMSFDLYCVGFADNLTELRAVHIRIGWELHDPDRPDRRGGGDCSYEGGCIIVLRIEREGLLLKDLPFDSTTPRGTITRGQNGFSTVC